MLCGAFLRDPSSVNYRQVCCAKEADLSRPESLAKKTRVLRLIAKRGLKAEKQLPAASVDALIAKWSEAVDAGVRLLDSAGGCKVAGVQHHMVVAVLCSQERSHSACMRKIRLPNFAKELKRRKLSSFFFTTLF